jgi:hypothetical protein
MGRPGDREFLTIRSKMEVGVSCWYPDGWDEKDVTSAVGKTYDSKMVS